VVSIDREAPLRFLSTGYEPTDCIAVFLKTYRTGDTAQRIVSVPDAASPRFQGWLRYLNAQHWNVYVSVNAVRPGRSRTREAIEDIRHVFLEEDSDGLGLLAALTTRSDLPPPSYVLHSSPGRVHVFWRVRGFDSDAVETVQKRLARELRSDAAATSCAQTTRLPGFANHKRDAPWTVTIEYLHVSDSARRHGLGKALIAEAVAWAEHESCLHLAVVAPAIAREANRFLARLGLGQAGVLRFANTHTVRRRLNAEHAPNLLALLSSRRSAIARRAVSSRAEPESAGK